MKVLQILPELNGGGVERGTLEVAHHLVTEGHESLVVSNGGRMVAQLELEGSRHIAMPVHKKSLGALTQVLPLRRLMERERPDIIHYRSRVPGWIAWLAWRGMDPATRPRLVSTVHGFYSVNAYSAIMTRGERVIAVSASVGKYIREHYPKTSPKIIRVIHRGVDTNACHPGYLPDREWLDRWHSEHPELKDRMVLLMPGRLSRWKGQEDFLKLIHALLGLGLPVQGLVAGEAHARKPGFAGELRDLAANLGIESQVSFLGHRSDLREVMAVSDLVLSLSREPEAFGRVSLEAMALGLKTIGYDHGGVAEQLADLFPQGRVPPCNHDALVETCRHLIASNDRPKSIVAPYTLDSMCRSTLAVYHELTSPSAEPG